MLKVENKIVKDIFSQEDIDKIYEHIDNTPEDKQKYQTAFAHTAYFSWLPQPIVDKIIKIVNDNFDSNLVLKELSFARYENSRGMNPLLFPHYDETFKEQRVTFDIQLKASKPWAIVVEDRPYILEDNQALFFSGTHQIHWREKTEFEKDDRVDMIFCHFAIDGAETLSSEHFSKMNALKKKYQDEYYS